MFPPTNYSSILYFLILLCFLLTVCIYPLSHLSQLLSQANNTIIVPMSTISPVSWIAETTLPPNLHKTDNKVVYYPKLTNKFLADLLFFKGKHVLVTGCTGFFGPILLSEILSQYPLFFYCLLLLSLTAKIPFRCENILSSTSRKYRKSNWQSKIGHAKSARME